MLSEEIKIAFYIGQGSFTDKVIAWWTSDFKDKWNGKWKNTPSHVELSLEPKKDIWYSASTRNGIYRKKVMSLNESKWRVYTAEVNSNELRSMLRTAVSFLGKKYDSINVFGSDIMNLNIGDPDRLTCDEGAARILMESELGSGIEKVNELNPKRLEDYIVYTGKFTLQN